jgi:serine/threonine protein kinase
MAVVCPSCEVLPEPDAPAGTRCRGCGARLIGVKAVELAIGTVIDGRFEIRERLGSGAMGVVYRATQLSIGRDVALKVLASIESEPVVKRFFREARIASALSHPSSVQIIEFGQDPNGHVYLAMELVRGHTLMAELQKGPLPSRRLTRIGVQLCDVIEAAHRLQIVHRDLKLENVMISDDGTDHIRVLDFGIARILGDVNTQVTASGLSAGTPHYMAPEVLTHAADPAPPQDVYALGVILAELAIGEPLWTNATSLPMLLIEKMKNTVVDRVPANLRPLVRRLMDPEASMRPTPAETRRALLDLDRLATDAAGVAPAIPPPIREPLGAAPTDQGLGPLDLVDLDERDAPTRTASAFVPPPAEPALKLDIVEPGASLDLDKPYTPVASPTLEIEGDWEKNRGARRATPSHEAERFRREHGPSTAGGGGRWLLLALVAVAVGGAAVYGYVSTKSARTPAKRTAPASTPVKATAPRPHDEPDDDRSPPTDSTHGVSIRIIGLAGMPITIDGSPAGKLPLKLTRSAGKKPIVIEGTGVYRVVIPDHTQTVDLTQ